MAEGHNQIRVVRSIAPISLGATGSGGKTGVVIDRNGFETVEFELSYGAITATGATVVVTFKEGDVTGTMTSVADADLISTELLAGMPVQATARTSGVGKNVVKRAAYKGAKRYVQVVMAPTVSGGIVAGANVILGGARKQPTAA
jgi:hypothetical protein